MTKSSSNIQARVHLFRIVFRIVVKHVEKLSAKKKKKAIPRRRQIVYKVTIIIKLMSFMIFENVNDI